MSKRSNGAGGLAARAIIALTGTPAGFGSPWSGSQVAQATIKISQPGTLTRVLIPIRQADATPPGQVLTAHVMTDDTDEPDAVLASSAPLNPGTLPDDEYTWVTFTFATPVELPDFYHIAISADATSAHPYRWGVKDPDATPASWIATTTAGPWTANNGDRQPLWALY